MRLLVAGTLSHFGDSIDQAYVVNTKDELILNQITNMAQEGEDPWGTVHHLISELINPDTRLNAIYQLSQMKELHPGMGPLLWHSFGTMAIFLWEITNCCHSMNTLSTVGSRSERICNVNVLLQSVAMNINTRTQFIQANIPLYLYPFLMTTSRSTAFEHIRLTALGVMAAMLKTVHPGVVEFLLTTDFLPKCYNCIELGSPITKALGVYILDKMLLDDFGLAVICRRTYRLNPFIAILNNTVASLDPDQGYVSTVILKHIIHCYLLLIEVRSAREAIRENLPMQLWDGTLLTIIEGDWCMRGWAYLVVEYKTQRREPPRVKRTSVGLASTQTPEAGFVKPDEASTGSTRCFPADLLQRSSFILRSWETRFHPALHNLSNRWEAKKEEKRWYLPPIPSLLLQLQY
ncbi:hypothetical protein GE061_011041 [Apolygus lucorum]|uniref:CCR4-NOT transcription complex subunit 9 n=1 Tax=Apolygus lucorum TaxID=248454 RepID=A0A8S9XW82_APOLU|nr:hypothetical protein GE061_011041 [Apolygus lucorum]